MLVWKTFRSLWRTGFCLPNAWWFLAPSFWFKMKVLCSGPFSWPLAIVSESPGLSACLKSDLVCFGTLGSESTSSGRCRFYSFDKILYLLHARYCVRKAIRVHREANGTMDAEHRSHPYKVKSSVLAHFNRTKFALRSTYMTYSTYIGIPYMSILPAHCSYYSPLYKACICKGELGVLLGKTFIENNTQRQEERHSG